MRFGLAGFCPLVLRFIYCLFLVITDVSSAKEMPQVLVTCGFLKLPGQDSNLDKESQNLSASLHKSLSVNTSVDTQTSVAQKLPTDPDFDRLASAWPSLPVHIKAAVLALLDAIPPHG
ncbi:MAG: hypothetical protein ACYC3I_20235 [Gemmataceae bacterium]